MMVLREGEPPMNGCGVSSGNRRWSGLLLAGGLLVCVTAGSVNAEGRFLVLPDGERIPLIRSQTEYAVTFGSLEDVRAGKLRLASRGRGIVEDRPGREHSRIKLLRVLKTSREHRKVLRQDPSILDVRPIYRQEGVDEPLVSTGTINVKLRPGLSEDERSEFWKTYRVEVVKPVEGLHDVYLIKPLDEDEDEVLRAEALAFDSQTVWAQPNFIRRLIRHQIVPSDPYFTQQWHLDNTGQHGGVAGADISALGAWVYAEGQDVLIGMFDDACDVDHEDLSGNYIGVGQDAYLPSNDEDFDNPRPKQTGDRHGTAVIGLAVARANGTGVRGVAYLSRFTVSRGLDEDLSDQQIASVYTFARQQGVGVHINSWGYPWNTANPSIVVEALRTAFEEGRDPDEEGDADPLGMVVVFASGDGRDNSGPGEKLDTGRSLAMLDTVIGVGASTISDRVATYSNYGSGIDILAPGGDETAGLATVDNDEEFTTVDDGYNVGGVSRLGETELDPNGRYTKSFTGTSAACPVAAGVVALILSANPLLTATDVRLIMEHSSDRASPGDAAYHNITGRSTRYAYGRINAEEAVLAAREALDNGFRTWPAAVNDPRIESSTLKWESGVGTREFLIIESNGSFGFDNDPDDFFPADGVCYSREQLGCQDLSDAELGTLPPGVTVTAVVSCSGICSTSDEQTLEDVDGDGDVAYAVYGRNGIARYSWGVEADLSGGGSEQNGSGDNGETEGPKVTIQISVTEGTSPLTVVFTGNAQRTSADIDESRTQWDFDIDDGVTVNSTSRNASHTYEVPAGETRTFIARLTMYDVDGNPGAAQVTIRVQGASVEDGGGGTGQSNVRIIIGIPGTVDSDVDEGTAPFEVQLSVDATTLAGTLSSVTWDLGDGTTATSIVVPHTYYNETDADLRFPITAIVATRSGSTTQTASATRVITVHPGTVEVTQQDPDLPGTDPTAGTGSSTTACGALGMLPLTVMFATVTCLRRRYI